MENWVRVVNHAVESCATHCRKPLSKQVKLNVHTRSWWKSHLPSSHSCSSQTCLWVCRVCMCVAALIVVLFYGNYEVLRRHLMPTIIFFLCLYSFSVCTLSNRSHMNQASTVASVSPSVYYFFNVCTNITYTGEFSVWSYGCFWLFLAVSTASTQFLICVSCISVEWLFDADSLQGRRTCPRRPGRGQSYHN